MIMILISNIYQLIDFFTFLTWIFYALDIAALFVLRKRAEKVSCEPESTSSESDYKLKVIKNYLIQLNIKFVFYF